ncbi:hypothetical protein KBA73_04500 [Patescibacteria group bacterium]|nr:hypothetical protein [Patescibacteria group bacterium]
MKHDDWLENVVGLLKRNLLELHPRLEPEELEQRISVVTRLLHELLEGALIETIALAIERSLNDPESGFRVRYDRTQKRYRMPVASIFREMCDVILPAFHTFLGEEIIQERQPQIDLRMEQIIACVLDAYHTPLCWRHLTRQERRLAEAAAAEFLKIPMMRLKAQNSPARIVYDLNEPLEPRLRVFMNTFVRNGGQFPAWYRSLTETPPPPPPPQSETPPERGPGGIIFSA